jgi:hypothetical protein
MAKMDWIGGLYKGRSIGIDSQECTNWYLEQNLPNSKNNYALIPTPGLKLISSSSGGVGGGRGLFTTANGRLLRVIANRLEEIATDYTVTNLGTLNTSTGRVSFAEVITSTGSIVQVVDGSYGYTLITESNTFAVISGDYIAGTSIVSINGRFIQNTISTSYGGTRYIYSGQYDFANTWAASIDYYTAEVSPDPILNIQQINSEIWLLGPTTVEIWYPTGSSDDPFSRQTTGVINIGTAARYGVCNINNYIAWVGSNIQGQGQIWLANGYIPQRISTHAIEYIIGQMTDISDCISYAYQQEGHVFLVFNFLTGNRTLVYDLTTQAWHERASYDAQSGKNNYHRVVSLTYWANKIVVGDYNNDNLYQWDLDTYTDNGQVIKRVRTGPHHHNDRKRVFYRSFELDIERGTGLLPTTGPTDVQGSDPQIMLEWSDDGGYTWSNEHWVSAGRHGSRYARAIWRRLGHSRDRLFRVSVTDPVKIILIDAQAYYDVART